MKFTSIGPTRQQAAFAKAAAGCRSPRPFALIAAGCFLGAATPVLGWYVRRVVDRSDEPLGIIALVIAMVLLAMRSRKKCDHAQMTIHPARMVAGAALLAVIQVTPWVHFPLIAGLVAVGVLGFSVKMSSGKAGILALLVLSLPLVASLDFYAGYPLRLAAAHIAVLLLNLCGMGVERVGVLMLDGESLVGMDPPCAGVRMLWMACFTAAVIAAQERLAWRRTLLLLLCAVGCVVLGNGVRAALVYFPESGRVHWPAWMHAGIGLAVHGAVLAAVFWLGERFAAKSFWRRAAKGRGVAVGDRAMGGVWRCMMDGLRRLDCFGESSRFVALRSRSPKVVWLAVLFGLVAVGGVWRVMNEGDAFGNSAQTNSWPRMLDGIPLVPLPLSTREARFAQAFPGQIAKFQCGDAEVIFRRVAGATRFMHPSGDCLRAAGFVTTSKPVHKDPDGRLWGCSLAERGGETWRVRERYLNAQQTRVCTDASAWFWEAVLHPAEGPWTAITVMERITRIDTVIAAR